MKKLEADIKRYTAYDLAVQMNADRDELVALQGAYGDLDEACRHYQSLAENCTTAKGPT